MSLTHESVGFDSVASHAPAQYHGLWWK